MKQRVAICLLNFPPSMRVAEIPSFEACQIINEAMKEWGVPEKIKIDNGLPFVFPKNIDIPTLSQLWWIGLGIKVNINTPKVPQQNGTVEGLQGICKRWSSPTSYKTLESYQQRLNETTRHQREVHRMRRNGDKTRKELYPELWMNTRTYAPETFSMAKIHENLALRVWKRRIRKSGSVKFWGAEIYIGTRFMYQVATITFDPIECLWLLRTTDGALLKTSDKELFTKKQILTHAGIFKK